MLKLHWKAARWPMLPVLIAAFGLPMMAGRFTWGRTYSVEALESRAAWTILQEAGAFALTFPFLAVLTGIVVALTAWNWDHKAGHVYTLSLPISRWRYATMKFVTGLFMVGGTAGIFLSGASITSSLASLPPGLNTYPVGLSVHFFLASLTTYAIFFALAAGTIRTAVIVMSTAIALTFAGPGMVALASQFVPALEGVSPTAYVASLLFEGPGPLSIFGGSWMLIDV